MCLAENLRQGLFTNYLDKLKKGGGINFNFTFISFIKFYLKVKLSTSQHGQGIAKKICKIVYEYPLILKFVCTHNGKIIDIYNAVLGILQQKVSFWWSLTP